MNVEPEQQKKILITLAAVLAVLVAYRLISAEKPRTAPLVYARGSVATSAVRGGIQSSSGPQDPLRMLMAGRDQKYPGVVRDLFRMENPAPPRPKQVVTAPTPTVPPPPPIPVKSPEEIAAEAARAELSRFRFLGYVTERAGSSLFLAKDGDSYIVRTGDPVVKSYRVKQATKDSVVLVDTATRVEVKIELSGGAEQQAAPRR